MERNTHCEEHLQGRADHLYVLVVQQAATDRDHMVVLWSQWGVRHCCN